MSGVHRAGAEAEDLYVGLQVDGPRGTMNAGAATPTWANPDCCDVFDFAADTNPVLYTTCCGPGPFLVLTGPGCVGGGQPPAASQPPGAIVGLRASDAIAPLAD